MSPTYLITGGAGNLACQLTFALAERGIQSVLMDIADRPVAAAAVGTEYVRADLTNTAAVADLLKSTRPTAVLHFASLLSGSCERDRAAAWKINVDGTFALFELCLTHGAKTVLIPSTLATYGGDLDSPLQEDQPQWPNSLYGVTKVAAERLGVYYARQHGLDFRGIRLPIVVSRHAPAGAASAYASRAFVESVQQGQFTFAVNPHTRVSTVYVNDVLSGIADLLFAPANRLTRCVYNIHSFAPSAQELADAIRQRLPQTELTFKPDCSVTKLIESWPATIDDSAARRDWGWNPRFGLAETADDLLRELVATPSQTSLA